MILSVYIDDDTFRRLIQAAADTGRTLESLAEAAVAEAALRAVPDTRPPHLRDEPLPRGV